MPSRTDRHRRAEPSGYTEADRALVHALWDDARTARLSELYFGDRATTLGRASLIADIAIAVTASGSGISGLPVVNSGALAGLWGYLAFLTAVLAVAKPLLAIEPQIRLAAKLQQTYRRVLGSYEDLAFDIEQAGQLTTEHRLRFQRIRKLLREATEQEPGAVSTAAIKPLEARVAQEMPSDRLWMPRVTTAAADTPNAATLEPTG